VAVAQRGTSAHSTGTSAYSPGHDRLLNEPDVDGSAMMGDVAPVTDSRRPILGRERELAQLVDLLGVTRRSARPSSHAVLLAGDAGVGKTRLLAELVDRATEAGWRTLVGHCLDFGDSALPYLPFSELFGRLAGDAPEVVEALTESHLALSSLQPGRRLLSGRGAAPTENLERSDLFDAIHGAFEELARTQPLLVVVEDVHWADRSTRDLLSFLFARPFRGPVAVVASYRSDDLHRRHPLRATAAQWARVPGVARVQVDPLGDDDVRRLVRSLMPGLLSETDLHTIVRRAEGNAFFVEELVGATQPGGAGLPDDLADLLLVRLDRLDDEAREVVRAASCAGRRVSHALLAAVVGLADDALDRALRTAVEQNILVRVGADGYAFRHALLAEAVYDDLLPGERVRLHGAYTDALLGRLVDGTAAELARHARAAHDVPTAVRASIQAGDEAMSVGGPDEAAEHYETALELSGDGTQGVEIDAVRLTTQAADALVASGRPQRARKLVEAQLSHLPADAPAHHRARLLMALGSAALLVDGPLDPLEQTTEALDLVPDEPTPLRARLLGLHARAHAEHAHYEDAARYATEALALAQKLDISSLVADATTTLATIQERAGDPATAEKALEEIVEQARLDADPVAEMRGRYLLAGLHQERGDLAQAQAAYHLGAVVAREAGRPWAPYGFEARLMEATVAYQRGAWDEAVELTELAGQSPPPVAETLLLSVRAAVYVGRGDPSVVPLLEQVRAEWHRDGLIGIIGGAALIDWYGARGDVPAMLEAHADVVRVVSALWTKDFQASIRLNALALGHLADAAAAAPHAERAELVSRAPELVAAVERVMQRVHKRKRPFGPEGVAWLERTYAEHLRLRWLADVEPPDSEELVAGWERTVVAFEAMGHRYETARSRARLASVLRACGQPAEAREVADEARRVARELGAEPLLATLRQGGEARSREAGTVGHLTSRETEILGLVAQGRSNGEIARQLFISTKTVSVHVSNILAKLGAGGRTEAAAIARRAGLLPD
jgi:DNA-binding CsgD family transcriptional regulator